LVALQNTCAPGFTKCCCDAAFIWQQQHTLHTAAAAEDTHSAGSYPAEVVLTGIQEKFDTLHEAVLEILKMRQLHRLHSNHACWRGQACRNTAFHLTKCIYRNAPKQTLFACQDKACPAHYG
jgi:hypothetical protein